MEKLVKEDASDDTIRNCSTKASDAKLELDQYTTILKNELEQYESSIMDSYGKLFNMFRDCQLNYFRACELSLENSIPEPILSSSTIDKCESVYYLYFTSLVLNLVYLKLTLVKHMKLI